MRRKNHQALADKWEEPPGFERALGREEVPNIEIIGNGQTCSKRAVRVEWRWVNRILGGFLVQVQREHR